MSICIGEQKKEIKNWVLMGKRSRKKGKRSFLTIKIHSSKFLVHKMAWKAFKEVFPAEKYLVGKRFTKAIVNV